MTKLVPIEYCDDCPWLRNYNALYKLCFNTDKLIIRDGYPFTRIPDFCPLSDVP